MINDNNTPETEQDENQINKSVETSTEDNSHEEEDTQGVEYWKAEALKNKAILDRNKQKNAEQKSIKVDKPVKSDNLNSMDMLAIIKAGVDEEDIKDVVEYASFKNISVAEALKTGTVKAIISEKSEFRKTAELTNTANAKRTTNKVSDDVLIANVSKGIMPEKGSEEAERLFWARRGGKR